MRMVAGMTAEKFQGLSSFRRYPGTLYRGALSRPHGTFGDQLVTFGIAIAEQLTEHIVIRRSNVGRRSANRAWRCRHLDGDARYLCLGSVGQCHGSPKTSRLQLGVRSEEHTSELQ